MIWLNHQLYPSDQAMIPVQDRGLTLGDGLFETLLVRENRLLRLDAHWQRLIDGAALLRLPIPLTREQFQQAVLDVLAANKLRDAAVRLTITRGIGQRGLLPPTPCHPTCLITTAPPPPVLGPATLHVVQGMRRNPHSPLSRCKTLSYLDNVLARVEAEENAADDGLILNTDHLVCETSVANLFVRLANGQLVTPALAHGVLPGVRRGDLLAEGQAQEQAITLQQLATASEIFMTNALGIRPVVQVRDVWSGTVGPLTRQLMDKAE